MNDQLLDSLVWYLHLRRSCDLSIIQSLRSSAHGLNARNVFIHVQEFSRRRDIERLSRIIRRRRGRNIPLVLNWPDLHGLSNKLLDL
jgi:hypothetical protein